MTGITRLGLGGSKFGSFGNPAPAAESERLVRIALDLGVNVIDTASIYGQGDSERIIGRAIAGRRDTAFVVTKGGQTFSAKYRLLRTAKPLVRALLARRAGPANTVTAQRSEAMRADWRPRAIVASLEASLRRLRTDRVEAFLLHSPPAHVAGDAELALALVAARAAGKALRIGVSCDDLATLDAALDQPGYDTLELPWNVLTTLGKRAETIAARGHLVLAREVVTQQPGLTPAQAVARAIAHPAVACTVVGTGRVEHLRALAAIARGSNREAAR
ncbi:aldo/keto reductase [Sphingomonas sp. Leaf231]|uniref:aldo/keto reductase n=1 Tax=Sphingomonas sp. Leaf231 TaxID=1736301 RepID=UPI000AAA3031|nr:aldo/keto reductase [Sphingomonas sp. Leaf231]